MISNNMLSLMPCARFPKSMYFGKSSLFYLKSLQHEKKLLLVSKSAWDKNRSKLESALGSNMTLKIIPSEPSESSIREINNELLASNYGCVIGFGGGSVMDVAKTAKLENEIKVILIPTTAGTGSEVSQYSVIVGKDLEKKEIVSEKLLPDTVLLDPSFLLSMPKDVLAYTTVDSISHAIEGLVSRKSSPFTDSLALLSIDMIFEHALNAYQKDSVQSEMESLQIAGILSGIVQSSASVGLIHACAHYFGPKLSVPHGIAVSIFMLPVLEYNISKTDKYSKLSGSQVLNKETFLNKLKELLKKMYLKRQYNKLDFSKIDFENANKQIRANVCAKTNPCAPSEEDIKTIFEQAGVYEGG